MINEIQREIIRLKKELNVTILAHSYESQEIIEIADYTGDSFRLSEAAQKDPNPVCIMCGVHFMAETVKILSPQKRVILSHPQAGCPMAEQISPEFVLEFKKQHPDFKVVAYINTTAALKTVCDVCVTSASAVKICKALPCDNILFIPDCNLGRFVKDACPEKNIELVRGGCPVHSSVTKEEVIAAKALHPDALLLVHPECLPEVTALSDYAGSTAGIMEFARKSTAREFIIGTEISIADHLAYECPDKRFHALSRKLICPDMRLTGLMDVYHCLKGDGGVEISLDSDTIAKARVCIDEMLRLG